MGEHLGGEPHLRSEPLEIAGLVARARMGGATWAQVSDLLGVSAQAAQKRYSDRRYDSKTGRAWR